VPVGFWFHFLKDAETGDALKDPGMPGRDLAGHKAFIEAFKPDMVKVMTDGFFFYPRKGPPDGRGGPPGPVSGHRRLPPLGGGAGGPLRGRPGPGPRHELFLQHLLAAHLP
jgi:hypothetical protein